MRLNFYLQHSLTSMYDPYMKAMLEKEGMKGYGAYWIILEKLALLPEPCAPLGYMKPFCKSLKISFAYIKKIILDYQLFTLDEEGYFMPIELNSPQKKENKTAVSAKKSAKIERKLNGSTPLLEENQQKSENCENQNTLNNSDLPHNTVTYKDNIYIITSSSERKKENPDDDDDDSFIETLKSGGCVPLHLPPPMPTVTNGSQVESAPAWTALPPIPPNHASKRPKPRNSPSQTTLLAVPNDAARESSAPWFGAVSYVIPDGELCHWGRQIFRSSSGLSAFPCGGSRDSFLFGYEYYNSGCKYSADNAYLCSKSELYGAERQIHTL